MTCDSENETNYKESFKNIIIQLRRQQKRLEKVTETAIVTAKSCLTIETVNNRQQLSKKLQSENNVIKKQIINTILMRNSLKKNIKDKNKLKELGMNRNKINVSYFEKCILNIEQDICTLKTNSNSEIERLKCEENDLNLEIERILQNKNLLLDENCDRGRKNILVKNWKLVTNCQSKEVVDFSNFVHTYGGHEGGWGVDDHQIFVKYYHQNEKNIINLIKVLAPFLPEKTDESIIQHVEWYLQYQEKKECYKRAIVEWRKCKNKQFEVQKEVKVPEVSIKNPVQNNPKKTYNDKLMKEKIKQWKQKRLKLEEEKKQISQKFQKSKTENNKFDIKVKIESWKKIKLEEEHKKKEERKRIQELEQQMRVEKAKKLIREYQMQDREYIQRRREMKCSAGKKNSTLKTRSTSLTHITRDPDRLHRATKQWLAKIRQPCDSNYNNNGIKHANNNILHVNNIPKLRKPDWIGSLPAFI